LTRDPSLFPVTLADERRLDRRRFLAAAGVAAAVALVRDRIGRRAERSFLVPVDVPARNRDTVARDLAALAIGAARPLAAADGREALAVRLDAATVVAFDRRCPHLGCPVRWAAERGRFECPCHGAAFDARTGAVLFGPPTRGLTPVRGVGVAL
jgi:nitrite reductase/ring-hydroxylating ferredoxin subunit